MNLVRGALCERVFFKMHCQILRGENENCALSHIWPQKKQEVSTVYLLPTLQSRARRNTRISWPHPKCIQGKQISQKSIEQYFIIPSKATFVWTIVPLGYRALKIEKRGWCELQVLHFGQYNITLPSPQKLAKKNAAFCFTRNFCGIFPHINPQSW